MPSTLATRHYPKIGGLVRRTRGDIAPESLEAAVFGRAVLVEILDPAPKNPRLVSSAHGTIEQLLLTIPSYAVETPEGGEDNPLAAAYRDLLHQLPKTVKPIVLAHASVTAVVEGWITSAGYPDATIIAAPDHLHFSVWAEDGYVVVHDQDAGATVFLEPYEFPRYGDSLVADFVSHATDLKDTQAPLYFQGGNVLVGDDFFFIGADYPANTLRYINRILIPEAGESPADAVRRLYSRYFDPSRALHYVGSTIPVPTETSRSTTIDGERWTEVLYLGNRAGTVQPLFHIDMFVTLAGRDASGRYRVLVGDPAAAARILGVPVWPHAMAHVFDNIAEGLERRGFSVIRNPLPLAFVDDPIEKTRLWYFATSNNALVQIADQGRDVWLPSYGFGAWPSLGLTDAANRKVWEDLGFTVHMLGDFHPFAENLGAVHCIKKYLRRG